MDKKSAAAKKMVRLEASGVPQMIFGGAVAIAAPNPAWEGNTPSRRITHLLARRWIGRSERRKRFPQES